jgi:hypothetical protein
MAEKNGHPKEDFIARKGRGANIHPIGMGHDD